jgi:glycerol kinase
LKHILAIDQGTTGSTALLLDEKLNVLRRSNVPFKQHFPKAGWVEHDYNEIWQSVAEAIQDVCDSSCNIVAIGISNQRETVAPVDVKTGEVLKKAIVWQCRRTQDICEELRPHEPMYREKTGLRLDPYFSGTKIAWFLRDDPSLKRKDVVFMTVDAFILYKLTGVVATDASNASRTLLYDLHVGDYTKELCDPLGVSMDQLPPVKDSVGIFGTTKAVGFLADGIAVSGILGDQQAALAGQACFQASMAKCTYGTGAFLLMNMGEKPKLSEHGLLTSVAWSIAGKRHYALEGSAFIAGAVIQFLRDQFGFLKLSSECTERVRGVSASPQIYFVPALAGLSAPYWQADARGMILGLTRGTTQDQILRAGVEGIAFQVADLVDCMQKDTGLSLDHLAVDGGACENDVLMQFQADLIQKRVLKPKNLETTAFGAAMMAAVGVGLYDLDTLKMQWEQIFEPDAAFDPGPHRKGWQRAVAACSLAAAD